MKNPSRIQYRWLEAWRVARKVHSLATRFSLGPFTDRALELCRARGRYSVLEAMAKTCDWPVLRLNVHHYPFSAGPKGYLP